MKRLFTSLTLILLVITANAQKHYQFRTDNPQGFSIESSTKSGLSLHFSISELGIADVKYDDAEGQELVLKGCFATHSEGLPNLPFMNQYIAVPQGAKVNLEVKEKASKTLHEIELLPAAPLQLNGEDKRPALHWDMSVFGKDADYPSDNVTIAQTTQIRGLDVVLLNVTPFRYNPVRKTLEVVYDMDIEVHFEGGDGQFGSDRYRNPAWDGILRDLVINSDMLPEAHYYDFLNKAIRNREEGCEYLIISPDESEAVAWTDTLKAFRTKQGILTKVVTLSECGGNNPETIRNYLIDAYNNWTIPPVAVLLFSGRHIQSDFGIMPFIYRFPGSYYDYTYPTDNPYADMNGDSIPDMAISRLLAYSPEDYELMVHKTIDYEMNPPTDDHYYDHPIVTSNYAEELWFMITSQSVNGFYRDQLGKHPTNLYMVYDYFEEGLPIPDSIWSTAENTSTALDYFGPAGTNYIPASIGALDDWIQISQTGKLINAFNKESFLTLYRDHSNPNLWCAPFFSTSNVSFLSNKKPTFLFSIGCLTNDYYSYPTSPSLIETFCLNKVGAVGGIGAGSATYSRYNDLLFWGMFDYIWPNFMPTLASQNSPQFAHPAFALVAGKLFLNQQSFLSYWTQGIHKTLNLFGYSGETYLSLFTETPTPIAADINPFHVNDHWDYHFTVEEGAKVCVSKGNDIILVATATGQDQSVTLPHMLIDEQFTVTATMKNRLRLQRNVTITPHNQAYTYVKEIEANDQDGNGRIENGERVGINLKLCNVYNIASDGGDLILSCDSPYIEILQGTAHYAHVDPTGELTLTNAFSLKVADNVPDETVITFDIKFSEGENMHTDHFAIKAMAPVIAISPKFSITTSDGKPLSHIDTEETSLITFTISNVGHSTAEQLSADLTLWAPFVSVTSPIRNEHFNVNDSLSLTYEVNPTNNDINEAWLQASLNVKYGTYQTDYDTLIPFGGIFENFESDTLNPFFIWTNSGAKPWEYCHEDAWEGERCFISTATTENTSHLRARLRSQLIDHDGSITFYYKTDPEEALSFYTRTLNGANTFTSQEWQYGEVSIDHRDNFFNWDFRKENNDNQQVKIDNICFPPQLNTIVFAGNDLSTCGIAPVVLHEAYAYDHQTVFWSTDGDGQFEDEVDINTNYIPGSQDLANGSVALTLNAVNASDTIRSTIRLNWLSDFSLTGSIEGDSIVNKYENRFSHYSIEPQEGMRYRWQVEPAVAGYIYGQGHAIDIAWNLRESDADIVLSVTVENGCNTVPITKTISLIGYATTEWNSPDFEVFPNPTDGKVTLIVSENLNGKAVIEVFNLLGERMMRQNVGQLHKGQTLTTNLSKLASGLYIIKLSTENGSCSKKVSVK